MRATIFFNYGRHLWSLSSECSLACHTYCNAGHPFVISHLQGPVTLTPIAERLAVNLPLPVITIGYVAAGIRTHNLLLAGRTL